MAQNFVQEGDQIPYTLVAEAVSGDTILIGKRVGIALKSGAIGDVIQLAVEGVFEVAKTTGQAWTVGALVYFDNTTKKYTTTVGSNELAGFITLPAISGDTIGYVKINQ
jgi:predicted RecA/RadA family phage recombinase